MNPRWRVLLFVVAFSSFAGAAAAQTAETSQQPPRQSDAALRAPAPAAVAADAPNARLAALIRRDGVIVRNKGVSAVTRIRTGVYCILPTASTGIVPRTAIVTVTPEYYYSLINEIMVQWASAESGCPNNRIAVYTLADANRDGIYTFSNGVGFSIVVP